MGKGLWSMSEARSALLKKLSKLSSEIGFIEFDGKNEGQRYRYASAAGVLRKINKLMGEMGLTASSQSVVTHFEVETYDDGGKRKVRHHAVVTTELRVFDVDTGEFIMARGVGSGLDSGDKAAMKASTAAEKYAWRGMLTLGWGAEDPEADASTDEIAKGGSKPKDIISKIKACKTTAQLEALKEEVRLAGTEAIEAFKAHPKYVAPGGN